MVTLSAANIDLNLVCNNRYHREVLCVGIQFVFVVNTHDVFINVINHYTIDGIQREHNTRLNNIPKYGLT